MKYEYSTTHLGQGRDRPTDKQWLGALFLISSASLWIPQFSSPYTCRVTYWGSARVGRGEEEE